MRAPSPEIPHGTVSGYAYWGCREECCAAPHRDYIRQRHRDDAAGRGRLVDARAAGKVLAWLHEFYSWRAIGEAYGASSTALRDLGHGKRTIARRAIVEKILPTPPARPKEPALVSPERARRHLASLTRMGSHAIARQTGVSSSTVHRVRNDKSRWITRDVEARLLTASEAGSAFANKEQAERLAARLRARGWTNIEILRAIGVQNRRQLSFTGEFVRRSTVQRLRALVNSVEGPLDDLSNHGGIGYVLGTLDWSWRDRALCAGSERTTEFFAVKADGSLCAGCQVRTECLEFALQTAAAGVWGGTTERERQTMHPERVGICGVCGQTFPRHRVMNLYCSAACRQHAYEVRTA